MLVGLKIEVPSLAAARDALPPLLALLKSYEVKASFFPSLGPDPDAAPNWRPWRQAPEIRAEARGQLLRIAEEGHELGLTAFDGAAWRRLILRRNAAWTREQLLAGRAAFQELFGRLPTVAAAPELLINADVPLLEAELGCDYAVDGRGLTPYRPRTAAGTSRCIQLPVTLPRIPDLLARGEPLDQLHQSLFMESQRPLANGHLFSFSLGPADQLPVLEKLLVMWLGSQRRPGTVAKLYAGLDLDALPCHQLGLLSARDLSFAMQGEPVDED